MGSFVQRSGFLDNLVQVQDGISPPFSFAPHKYPFPIVQSTDLRDVVFIPTIISMDSTSQLHCMVSRSPGPDYRDKYNTTG